MFKYNWCQKRVAKTAAQLNREALEIGAFLLSTRWQKHLDYILAFWRSLLFGRREKKTVIGKQNTNHHTWDSVSAPRHSNKRYSIVQTNILSTHALQWLKCIAHVLKLFTLWNLSRTIFTENSTVAMPYISGQGQLTGNGLFQWKWTASRKTDQTQLKG